MRPQAPGPPPAHGTGRNGGILCLCIAINHTTRTVFVFVQIKSNKQGISVKAFLRPVNKVFPIKISRLLIDSGKVFTNCILACREREPRSSYEFNWLRAPVQPGVVIIRAESQNTYAGLEEVALDSPALVSKATLERVMNTKNVILK